MSLKMIFVCWSLVTLVTSLSPAAQAQTFSVIHTFTDSPDGAFPLAGVTVRVGVVYGTTSGGGVGGNGIAYQITHSGSNWVTTPISLFPGGGSDPEARLIFGPDGHPYGTTVYTSSDEGGHGIVFDLIPPISICRTANCSWKENIVYQFQGSPDAAQPFGDLIWDQQGNIYGTTAAGGSSNLGTVYELKRSGNTWTEAPIWSFSGSDGQFPDGGVVFDNNGNLFGTTSGGGLYGSGTVFELRYNNGKWVETDLYDFQGGDDGGLPIAGLIFDQSGNLYGATATGGSASYGGGTVFELSPSGDSWTFAVLHSFDNGVHHGSGPKASLTMDAAGNLYGTTSADGANQRGNVFKLTNTGNGWAYTLLYDFTGVSDGWGSYGSVTIDTEGTLYGTNFIGGSFDGPCQAQGCGTVWMIKP